MTSRKRPLGKETKRQQPEKRSKTSHYAQKSDYVDVAALQPNRLATTRPVLIQSKTLWVGETYSDGRILLSERDLQNWPSNAQVAIMWQPLFTRPAEVKKDESGPFYEVKVTTQFDDLTTADYVEPVGGRLKIDTTSDEKRTTRLYYLLDASGLLSTRFIVVAGFLNFASVDWSNPAAASARLHLMTIHPIYRPIGDLGCILLQTGEAKLLSEWLERITESSSSSSSSRSSSSSSSSALASSTAIPIMTLTIADVVFPGAEDDRAYHFYRRNGYRPLQLLRFTFNIRMSKTVSRTEAVQQINAVLGNDMRSRDERCFRRLQEYEAYEYDNAVQELEQLLIQASVQTHVYSASFTGGGTETRVQSKPHRGFLIPYRRNWQRNPVHLERRLQRLQRLRASTEAKTKLNDALFKAEQHVRETLALIQQNPHYYDAEYEEMREEMQQAQKDLEQQEEQLFRLRTSVPVSIMI